MEQIEKLGHKICTMKRMFLFQILFGHRLWKISSGKTLGAILEADSRVVFNDYAHQSGLDFGAHFLIFDPAPISRTATHEILKDRSSSLNK